MGAPDPVETFRQEAADLLERLEQVLLDLEADPGNAELVNDAFRALHTLKGSGSMFGFTAVATFLHEFETAFDRVRKGAVAPSHDLVRIALRARDHVATLVATPDRQEHGGDDILADLRKAVGGQPTDASIIDAQSVGAQVGSGAADPASARLAPSASEGWHLRFRMPEDALAMGTDPLLLLDELRGFGECEVRALVGAVPTLDVIDPKICHLGWDVVVRCSAPRAAIEDVFLFLRDDMELSIEPLAEAAAQDAPAAGDGADTAAAAADAAVAAPTRPTAREAATLRVPAERLDEMMDRVGELVIVQARLSQLAQGAQDGTLTAVAEEIARLTSSLRDTTMATRMMPIGSLFGRFRRLVHDLSHDLGKTIDFVTSGDDTELDKTVMEQLADPLVHLIRNAVDHGLEDPLSRDAAGKPEMGTLRLSASHAGAEVVIAISDDGAGLNAERIRAKAEQAGLVAPGAVLQEHELNRLIFEPGFSTAQAVTSLSGRGVGMDVVKRTIDGLRGSIDIATARGKGTTITLRLPLTLAIIDGLLVRVGNDRYTIPLAAVEECVELPSTVDADAKGRNFLNMRGGLVPFLRLRDLFGAETEPDRHQKVVVVTSGNMSVGLVVDQIIGNNQTVIKQLSRLHSAVKTFSGATILGDGSVALILDVMHLVGFGQALEERHRSQFLGEGGMTAIETAGRNMRALTFRLQDEIFAIEAEGVREILDLVPITRVPNASPFVGGLINVRGTVVPLADLRVTFDMARPAPDRDTRIVVIEFELDGEPLVAGILADKVYDVAEVDAATLESVPKVGMRWPPEFVRAIGKGEENFIIIPDLERIFRTQAGHDAAVQAA